MTSNDSTSYRRYVLGVLTSVYLLNFLDRGLMMLLLQPIKEDLHLSDTQLGFLTGIAFALFYATVGLPLARLADRGHRVTLTSIAIGLWGVVVMATFFVTNFVQLVCARIAAAVGEAGCAPPTYALVGDYFPGAGERSRAMGVYVSGSTLSALISFVIGGWLTEQHGWRTAFLLMGVPGLVLAVLVKLTICEKRPAEAKPDSETRPAVAFAADLPAADARSTPIRSAAAPPLRAVLSLLWHQRSCRHLCIALVVLYLMSLGLSPWYAAFMIRTHAMGTAELGVWLGLIIGIGGTISVLLGGYAAGRWFAANERGQLRAIAIGIASLVPILAAFLLLPQKLHALIALVPLVMAFNFFFGPVYALLQRLVPDEMRATMLAVVMLLANLIGMGLGPQIVGILSDMLTPSLHNNALRYSMLIVSTVAVWGAWHFWEAGRTIEADLAGPVPTHR